MLVQENPETVDVEKAEVLEIVRIVENLPNNYRNIVFGIVAGVHAVAVSRSTSPTQPE